MIRLTAIILIACFMFTSCSAEKNEKNNEKFQKNESENLKKDSVSVEKKDLTSSIDKYIPENWKVKNIIKIPEKSLDYYSGLFGGKIRSIENITLSTSGDSLWYQFQINAIEAADKQEALKIYKKMTEQSTNKEKYVQSEKYIFEFVASNEKVISKCKEIFSKK